MALDPETFEALIETVRRFVAERLRPLEADVEANDAIPDGLIAEMRDLGLFGLSIAEAYGGLGLTMSEEARVAIEFGRTTPAFRSAFGTNVGIGSQGLVMAGTPEQKAEWLPRIASGEVITSFALTEPDVGSDSGAVKTRAVREGEVYRLTGTKRFISGSPFADYAVLMASTATHDDPDPKKREVTAFFVDLHAPGVRVESGYKTMAGQTSTGNIVLDGARVPAANLIGEPGRGLALALGRISVNRLLHCPAMLGLAQVALRDARDYAQQRHQFGRAIGQFQAIQHMLADMATDWAAARGLMLATARAIDAGAEPRAESSMAKLFCSEAAFRIADRAVQIHGGEGIVQGRRVEFLFRMLRMYRVLTGTSEIQKNTIAKELLGDALR